MKGGLGTVNIITKEHVILSTHAKISNMQRNGFDFQSSRTHVSMP